MKDHFIFTPLTRKFIFISSSFNETEDQHEDEDEPELPRQHPEDEMRFQLISAQKRKGVVTQLGISRITTPKIFLYLQNVFYSQANRSVHCATTSKIARYQRQPVSEDRISLTLTEVPKMNVRNLIHFRCFPYKTQIVLLLGSDKSD